MAGNQPNSTVCGPLLRKALGIRFLEGRISGQLPLLMLSIQWKAFSFVKHSLKPVGFDPMGSLDMAPEVLPRSVYPDIAAIPYRTSVLHPIAEPLPTIQVRLPITSVSPILDQAHCTGGNGCSSIRRFQVILCLGSYHSESLIAFFAFPLIELDSTQTAFDVETEAFSLISRSI